MVGYGWRPPRDQAAPEHCARAEALLSAFFAQTLDEFGAGAERAALLGFFQGGGRTAEPLK